MNFLVDGGQGAATNVILAHGAGAPMDSPFMTAMAAGLAAEGHRVLRFEFPYMAARREEARRRPPDRTPVLLQTFRDAVEEVGRDRPLFLGGKSMGGRIASMLADELQATGLICLGYPFHPAGKPERLRTEHLATLSTPALIIQGERDPLGSAAEVAHYALSTTIEVVFLGDGDHSFKPRKKSGRSEAQAWEEAVATMARFIAKAAR